jgi:hypothetical protein
VALGSLHAVCAAAEQQGGTYLMGAQKDLPSPSGAETRNDDADALESSHIVVLGADIGGAPILKSHFVTSK